LVTDDPARSVTGHHRPDRSVRVCAGQHHWAPFGNTGHHPAGESSSPPLPAKLFSFELQQGAGLLYKPRRPGRGLAQFGST
jgi:hypothetical protein